MTQPSRPSPSAAPRLDSVSDERLALSRNTVEDCYRRTAKNPEASWEQSQHFVAALCIEAEIQRRKETATLAASMGELIDRHAARESER